MWEEAQKSHRAKTGPLSCGIGNIMINKQVKRGLTNYLPRGLNYLNKKKLEKLRKNSKNYKTIKYFQKFQIFFSKS